MASDSVSSVPPVHRSGALLLALVVTLAAAACGGDDDDDAAAPTTTTAAPAIEAEPPLVIGHRGASGHFPDNTLEGIRGAADLGAEWVELDVRLSSDGVAVLSHDPATENGLVVSASTAEELAEVDVPEFADALALVAELGLGIDVEIKADPTEEDFDPSLAVVDVAVGHIDEADTDLDLVVSSFNREAIDRARSLSDDAIDTFLIAAGVGDVGVLTADLAAAGHEGIVVGDPAFPAEGVAAFEAEGLEVWAYTINEPAEAQELLDRGLTGIVTDFPDRIAEVTEGG